MITREMLTEWREAITRAIQTHSIDPSIVVAMQEMHIEAKILRRENLSLLNSENLINKMALYINKAFKGHQYTDEMDALIDEIEEIANEMNKDLGLKDND